MSSGSKNLQAQDLPASYWKNHNTHKVYLIQIANLKGTKLIQVKRMLKYTSQIVYAFFLITEILLKLQFPKLFSSRIHI